LWDEAMTGAWVQQQCRRAATKRGADPQDIHDAAQELERLFKEQVARRMQVGYVLDGSPYRADVLPTTWWLSIIKPKAKDAWRKTLRNRREFPVDTTTTELPPGRLPDEGSEYLENLFDVVLDEVVDGLEQFAAERKILSGWSSEDAGRILQAAKRWLYTETGILDGRKAVDRNLAGNIQRPCAKHLRDTGWLRETSNEKRSCTVAGALVEAAVYHALYAGAGGFPAQRRYLEKLVEAAAKGNQLLHGWSAVDAQAIVTAAQSWLVATREHLHELGDTTATECSRHLLEAGRLCDTRDEAAACRTAGSLAEAALKGANHAD
jgi:DNA-directed RNA polymerase specialized sigma24 family protein